MKTIWRLMAVLLCSLPLFAADTTPPVVLSITPTPGATVSNFTQVSVLFNEPVVGVLNWNILLNGLDCASVTNLGSTNFFFSFTQPPAGTVAVGWDRDQEITDASGNTFLPGPAWSYDVVDTIPPLVLKQYPEPGATVSQLSQVSLTFNEPVLGVSYLSLWVNGEKPLSVTGSGSGPYIFLLEQNPIGPVQFEWDVSYPITDLHTNVLAASNWTISLVLPSSLPSLRINEFMAAGFNTNVLKDEWGEAQDWIEIYNYGSTVANLTGYSLTDDPNDLNKWSLPPLLLNPGQFLLVLASGKDRRVLSGTNKLHSNFTLSSLDGYVGLFNAEFPRVALTEFTPTYPEQRIDISYGLTSAGLWRYFTAATPGSANGASTITNSLPPVHFSVDRGFFDAPFSLFLTHEKPGTSIRYTTNGSEPTISTGLLYTNALVISNTTVLRAAAFGSDVLPSLTATRTYLFLGQVLLQSSNMPPGYPVGPTVWTGYPSDYEVDPEIVTNAVYGPLMQPALKALPSMSIVINIDDMFGSSRGIYTTPEPPIAQRYLWERPCSIEYMHPDGADGFQIDCGIRIQGNASRTPQKTPKHPFRLFFKGKYGAGKLNYPVFPDSSISSFDGLVLRADFNNSWVHWDGGQRSRGSKIRDAWTKDTFREMGQPSGHSQHFHLYINGFYWGVYDFGERIDGNFAANYLGGEGEEYDAIASKPTEAIDGDLVAYNAMTTFIKGNDMAQIANFSRAQELLDMPNFMDYMLLNFYGANQDWGVDGNWNAIHRRGPGEKFKYCTWDGEQLVVNTNDNRTTSTDLPSGLHPVLINSPEYRLAFADRVQKHMFNNGALTPAANIARWQKRVAALDLAIIGESARWGDYRTNVQYSGGPYYLYTRNDHWVPENNRMLNNYFPQRHNIFLNQLRAVNLFPSVSAPVLSQHGGRVARGFTVTLSGTSTIYFTTNGADPRVYGSGAISSSAITYSNQTIVIDSSLVLKARTLVGGTWSPLTEALFTVGELLPPLRITELMYNPLDETNMARFEFIEIQNIGSLPLDIGGVYFDGINYQFPVGTILGAGVRLVLGSNDDTNAWKLRYEGVAVAGWYGGRLANEGEQLRIFSPSNLVLAQVHYLPFSPWPTSPNGGGYSLEIIDPRGDANDPANWRPSAAPGGTPGLAPAPVTPANVLIHEIAADNRTIFNHEETYPDWLELYNPGPSSVLLDNWSLSNDGNPRKYLFPSNLAIPAGGYLLVFCDTNNTTGLHAGFELDAAAGHLFLYDASTNRIDGVTWGPQLPDFSLGRIDMNWQLTLPSPEAVNIAAPIGSVGSLSVNEWLANAPPGGSDWIELFNSDSTQPVALRNFYLGTSNNICHLKAHSFIAPGGFVQLFADGSALPGHLNFNLPKEGGFISVFDETGLELSALKVQYGPQLENVSSGRLPDGWVRITPFPGSPSPAAPNYLASYAGPILNEVMAKHYRAVTNASGHVTDWLELYNSSAATSSLSGWSLSLDKSQPAQWNFPNNVLLPPFSYLVVWCDDSLPPTTSWTPGALLNTGRSIDGESGAVFLFNPARQLSDSVEFGFQVEDKSIGRSADTWQLLEFPTPAAPNSEPALLGSVTNLRFNEWMANPVNGDDWFELFNPDASPVPLGGLHIADDPSLAGITNFTIAPLSFVDPGGFVQFIADGNLSKGRNHAAFNLDAWGESLSLYQADLTLVDRVYYGAQALGVSQGRLPDGAAYFVTFPGLPTPGESNFQPLPNVVIHEILSRAVAPMENAIELFNPGGVDLSLAGWYLSDSQRNFKKFRIPNGTVLNAAGFAVFYAGQFNSGDAPFALRNPEGGVVWLSQADGNGNLTGYRARASFGPADTNTSFGRYQTSVAVDYPALQQTTFGADNPSTVEQFRTGLGKTNALPKIGPVVINEIMYHPPDQGTNDNVNDEYIELFNTAAGAVALYDPVRPANAWKIQGGVSFTFPANTSIPAGESILLVSFDPLLNPGQLAAFKNTYGLTTFNAIYGPYSGRLANGDEEVILAKPGTPTVLPPAPETYVPYIAVDRVYYGDSTPWPSGADGNTNGVGMSLQRRTPASYGNEPLNWFAAPPSPGADNGSGPAPPLLAQEPPDIQASAGTNVTLAVVASGDGPFTYLWQYNGAAILEATNSILTLYNVQFANQGQYSVLVSSSGATVRSRSANLLVIAPPAIVQAPSSQGAAPGGTATFSVLAIGGGLSYQWRFAGTNLDYATNATLTLSNIQPSQAGAYSVLISNSLSTITSDVVYLVVVAPAILTSPQGTTNFQGSTVTLAITASGDLPLTYQWRKNGVPVFGATNAVYIIPNAQAGHSGAYDVVVLNAVGAAVSPAVDVAIYVPVQIIQQPLGMTVKGSSLLSSYGQTGSNITFTVECLGTSPISYQWLLDGVPLPGAVYPYLSLPNVNLDNEGYYSVVITNNYSAVTSSPARLMIVIDPVIRKQPPHFTVPVGSTVQFPVVVTGNPMPLGFRWRKDGGPVPNGYFSTNSTNCTLTLANVAAANSGGYSVTVTNPAQGFAISASGYLTVVAPPASQFVKAGSNVTLRVTANCGTSTSKLRYQWQWNGTDLPGSTNNTLSLTNFQSAQDGIYTVVVIGPPPGNFPGSFSAQVFVDSAPPLIAEQPQSLVVTQGATATFTVLAGGPGPLSYQWQFAGTNLPGALGATLSISNVQDFNTGSYSVLVTNTNGFAMSAPATLSLGTPPVITTHPQNALADPGDSINFTVIAEGTAPLSYQWQFNGANLIDQTNAALFLAAVQLENQGAYTVRVTNLLGAVTSAPAMLALSIIPPSISVHPADQTVSQGSTVAFSVAADGTGPLQYAWLWNGSPRSDATNATLEFASVQYADRGIYQAVVSNAGGSVTSAPAVLTVLVPPTILGQPQNQLVSPGEDAAFMVVASSPSPLTYQWYLNGSPLSQATNDYLICTNVFYTNAGIYVVRVANSDALVDSNPAELNIRPRFTSQTCTNGLFRLQWEGVVGKSYAIQTANSFTNWSTLRSFTNLAVQVQFIHTNASTASNLLYRLKQTP